MQATGFSPDFTRKTTLTVFFHTIFPRANRTGGLHGETGERKPLYKPQVAALIERDGGTRKRFPHHTAPSLAVGRAGGALWRLFYLVETGEHRLPGASMPVHPALPAAASVYPPAGSDRGYPGRIAPGTWPPIRRAVPSGVRPAVPAGSESPTWFPN